MISFRGLTLSVAGRILIEDASLSLAPGAKAGLVGRNGTGKTTLFQAIVGEIAPDAGDIDIPSRARIGRVAQEAPGGERSLLETVLAADEERRTLLEEEKIASDPERLAAIHVRLADIDAFSAEARAATILDGLGFDEAAQHRACSSFSGGWRMRIALAAILFAEPDLLLLDEPTNYLDLEGTLWLERYLARYPHTVLIISHDRDILNSAVDSIIHLSQRKLKLYRGGYDGFERQRREQQLADERHQAKTEAQRAHMEQFVARFRAKATKARQAQSRLKALARLPTFIPVVEEESPAFIIPDPARAAAPPAIKLENVSAGYDGRAVLDRLDLRIDPDDRIGLVGANGNGKSTFAKLLAGEIAPLSGTVLRADKLRVAMFSQHQIDALDPARSAYEHVRAALPREPEAGVRRRVAQMGLSTEKMQTAASNLSGGEKARLHLGLVALSGPHLLILDEPTNHLDIDSREALIRALNAYEGALILISHDPHLLNLCTDRLWRVGDGTVELFDGDIGDYRRALQMPKGQPNTATDRPRPNQPEPPLRQRKAEKIDGPLLRNKIKSLEGFLSKAATAIDKIDKRLADGSVFQRDPQAAATLSRRRAELDAQRALAENEWLRLSETLEKSATGSR